MRDSAEIERGINTTAEKPVSFADACKAFLGTAMFYRKNRPNFPLEAAVGLVGMKMAFPGRFTNKKLANDPNIDFFKHLMHLGVQMNDAIDLNPVHRSEGKQKVVESIFIDWKASIRSVNATAERISERGIIIRDYQRETLTLEKYAREMSENEWSLEKALKYRELINAIVTVYQGAALLGTNSLVGRLVTIEKENLSWQTLEQKYAWMINGQPRNEDERKLCGLFYMVMGAQVIDDWYDLKTDQRLGLHSIATELMRSVNQDRTRGWEETQLITKSYYQKAVESGYTISVTKGVNLAMRFLKEAERIFPSVFGGRRGKLSLS